MRARGIFIVVTVMLLSQVLPHTLHGQKKTAPEGMALRQQVESDLLNLQRNLGKSSKRPEQLRFLAQFEKQLKQERSRKPRQTEVDEIFFDQLLGVLSEIPRSKTSDSSDCSRTRAQILANFEPSAQDEPQNPAVKYGLSILKEICR